MKPSVLVLSADPLIAALVAAAVELAGGQPYFANANERPRDALLRLRPSHVLVDCDDDRACVEAFLGPVLMTGARVVIFASPRARHDASELAERLGVGVVQLPLEAEDVAALLEPALD